MGAHLVRPFLGPENDRSFGARFFTDLNGFTRPTPKRKSRWSKNLGHETDGSHGGSQHGSGSCVCSFLGGATQYIQGTGKLKQSSCFLAESLDGAVGNSQRLHSA